MNKLTLDRSTPIGASVATLGIITLSSGIVWRLFDGGYILKGVWRLFNEIRYITYKNCMGSRDEDSKSTEDEYYTGVLH